MTNTELGPKEINLDEGPLSSTFGCREFEDAIAEIVKFLADDSRETKRDFLVSESELPPKGTGWKKEFRPEDIPSVDAFMFIMIAAAGWISNCWSPKWTFRISKYAIQKIQEYETKRRE